MIVTFSGVDGAGKTTQIERLVAALQERGVDARRFWFRPGYSDELNALRAAVRRLRPGALPAAGPSKDRDRAFSKGRVRAAWVAMALADTLGQLAVKVRAMERGGRVVVCDRWLEDASLDLAFRFPEVSRHLEPAWRVLHAAAPRPQVRILMMLPHDEMLARLAAKDEPFPDPPDVRDRRYAAYQALATAGTHTVVDAARSIEEVGAEILAAVEAQRRGGA